MDVRTQMRSAARCNARREAVAGSPSRGLGARRASVMVAEKYAAEIAAIRDELPELEHVLVRPRL
jgi:hypothetical protein